MLTAGVDAENKREELGGGGGAAIRGAVQKPYRRIEPSRVHATSGWRKSVSERKRENVARNIVE